MPKLCGLLRGATLLLQGALHAKIRTILMDHILEPSLVVVATILHYMLLDLKARNAPLLGNGRILDKEFGILKTWWDPMV